MASFLEELKKSNLQEGINKTGAGFQLPQIQPQVPQGQMLPQIQPLEDILTPEMVAQRAAARGGAGVPAVQPDPSLSRVDRFFKETIPGAVSGISELFSPLDEAASVYGERAQQKREEQAIGTAETFRKAGALKDVMLKEGSPTFSEAFEARGGTLMPQTPEAAAPAPAGTVMAPPPAAESVATGGVQPQTPQAPTDGLTTQSGIPLSQFLSGEAIPEAGLRAEAPVFSSESRGISGVAGQDIMAQASAEREARAEAQFGQVRGPDSRDRDRRMASGEGTSMADLTDMAKANARGASPRDVARGQKIADELGVDLKTGKPLEAQGGLTFDQQLALSKEQRAGRQEVRDVAKEEMEWEKTQGEARQKRTDEMNTEIGALTSIIGQAENIGGVAQEAGRQVGAGTTGFFSPLKWIGGTTAADLAGNLETIKSDAFVANITEMRQNSPTGGAVGNVSDKDLEMLQSLQTSFRQNLKPTTLRNNLKKYKEIRDKVSSDAKAGFIRKYGKENFNKHFGDGGTPQSESPSVSQPSGNDLVDKWNK